MTDRDIIITKLQTLKPNEDMESITDLIDGAYLDSIELMTFISDLMDTFDVDIDIEWITAEHFNSVDAIAELIKKIKTGEMERSI